MRNTLLTDHCFTDVAALQTLSKAKKIFSFCNADHCPNADITTILLSVTRLSLTFTMPFEFSVWELARKYWYVIQKLQCKKEEGKVKYLSRMQTPPKMEYLSLSTCCMQNRYMQNHNYKSRFSQRYPDGLQILSFSECFSYEDSTYDIITYWGAPN